MASTTSLKPALDAISEAVDLRFDRLLPVPDDARAPLYSLITPEIFKNKNIDFLHQYSAFEFDKIPSSILILGFNSDNLELADLYSNLGISVSIIEEKSIYDAISILDQETIEYLQKHLESRQIKYYFESNILEIVQTKKITVQVQEGQKIWIKDYEAIYTQVQETFVDKGLSLHRIGIDFNINGIVTDSRCRTSTVNVWALGDCNSQINKSNKLAKSTDFVFNLRRQSPSIRLWDMAGIGEAGSLSNSHINLEIKTSNPVFIIGMSFIQAEAIYNPDIESEMIQKIDQEGFVKVWFRPSSGQIVGATLVGEMSQYRHYINAAISRNINAIEVIRYIIGD